MKSQPQRAAERRNQKLAAVQQQIDEGTLTVRQMTPEERAKHPPRPRKDKRRRQRGQRPASSPTA